MEDTLVKDIIRMPLMDLNTFTHLQRRMRRLAKNPYTAHGLIYEFHLSITQIIIMIITNCEKYVGNKNCLC